jgi:hypothetical protein
MIAIMPNNNNNTWSNTIKGTAIRGNKIFEYNLKTLAVQDNIDSLFSYSIHPVALTVKESFLPESYTSQKVASISSQIDEEVRKDRIRAAYNAAENDPRALGPLGKAAAGDRAIGKGSN